MAKPAADDPALKEFAWCPGLGIDSDALGRLRSHFQRPPQAMGEAWFMGERRIFHELEGDLSTLTAWDLQEPLREIASGTSSFGPRDEWRDWYHYLLGQLLPRSHEDFVSSLLESFVTAFMALYPNGVCEAPYSGFRRDILLTLGRAMMASECWSGGSIVIGRVLHRSNNNPNKVWCWFDASGDFSASMFFCLKYLPQRLVRNWFLSALAIKSPHWRAQVIAWLTGAYDLLRGHINWPSELIIGSRPGVDWEYSHCLRLELTTADESGAPRITSLIPSESRAEALEVAKTFFSEEVFYDWLESIDQFPYLKDELAEIPATFESLYVRPRPDLVTR